MNYNEEIKQETKKLLTRRWFFKECGIGLGSLALASLLDDKVFAASSQQSAIGLSANGPQSAIQWLDFRSPITTPTRL